MSLNAASVPKLAFDNFKDWDFIIVPLLNSLGIASISDEVEDPVKDALALGIIRTTVSSQVLPRIRTIQRAHLAYNFLKLTYGTLDAETLFEKESAFLRCRMKDTESVSKYIARLTDLYVDVSSGDPPTFSEHHLCVMLYSGLTPPLREAARGWNKSLMSISAIRARLVDIHQAPLKGSALASTRKPSQSSNGTDEPRPHCAHCSRPGHTATRCFQLHPELRNVKKEKANMVKEVVLVASSPSPVEGRILLDCACTTTSSGNPLIFHNLREVDNVEMEVGDEYVTRATHTGDIHLELNNQVVIIEGALLVPTFGNKVLVSLGELTSNNITVFFGSAEAEIRMDGKLLCTVRKEDNLYPLEFASIVPPNTTPNLIHERMGHASRRSIRKTGLECPPLSFCDGCVKGDHPSHAFANNHPVAVKSTQLLELVHTDLCGPMQTPSLGGARYLCTMIDDKSRKAFVRFLKHKSQAANAFDEMRKQAERECGRQLIRVKHDGGGEYNSAEFSKSLRSLGIQQMVTTPYSHQQNGIAERFNRTVVAKARKMIYNRDHSLKFWAEAVNYATFIYNHTHHTTVECPPEQSWSSNTVDTNAIRVWGCLAWVRIPKEKRRKLDPQSKPMMFLGYSPEKGGYKLYDPKTADIVYSRDVIFDESRTISSILPARNKDTSEVLFGSPEEVPDDHLPADPIQLEIHPAQPDPVPPKKSLYRQMEDISAGADIGKRTRKQKTYYNSPILATDVVVPRHVGEAMSSPHAEQWKLAMDQELKQIVDNQVFELTDPPARIPVLPVMWIFSLKTEGGVISRFKARLVVRGCFQEDSGSDVYAPVVVMESLRIFFTIVAFHNLEIQQVDVTTAFLYADLDTPVYVRQPALLSDGSPKVWKLNRALYGLREAPLAWSNTLKAFLLSIGFHPLSSDVCVLTRGTGGELMIVHVDDMAFAASSVEKIQDILAQLRSRFSIKVIDNLSLMLNIRIQRDRANHTIFLSQTHYVEEILKASNMENSKPASTPMEESLTISIAGQPSNDKEKQAMLAIPYRRIVGMLMYLACCTRPDILYSVSVLSRYLANPGPSHWNAVKRVVRYLSGSRNLALRLAPGKQLDLMAFCDADWGRDPDTNRSVSGNCLFMGDALISFKCKRQETVALSTMEAEFDALVLILQEVLWTLGLLDEIGVQVSSPVTVFEDNQSCIKFAKGQKCHGRARHVERKFAFTRETIHNGTVELLYCPTDQQVADVFTKPLGSQKLGPLLVKLGLVTKSF